MDARLLRLRDTAVEETRAAAATRRVQVAPLSPLKISTLN